MRKEKMPSLALNTVTGPDVGTPSVSPDTLKRFNHPYYSFLQTYCVKKGNNRWYGRIANFGLQYPAPLIMVIPIEITELLGLDNRDNVEIELAQISAADTVRYEILGATNRVDSNIRPLIHGVGLKTGQEFEYEGNHIRIATIDPEQSYYDKTTHLEESSRPAQEDQDFGEVYEVQTNLLPANTLQTESTEDNQ